jgi:cell wall-associated NlpC family hydrolase
MRTAVALLSCAAMLALPAAPLRAEPAADGLAQLLVDKGILPAATAVERGVSAGRDAAAELVVSAMGFLGVPYRRGGNSFDEGFDCSGFVRHLFESNLGLLLPRRADEQARSDSLASVPRTELKPGDLVFFNTLRRAFSHVGLYIGDGQFIHAPRPGKAVRVENMHARYWSERFNGARRVQGAAGAVAAAAPAAAPAGRDAQALPAGHPLRDDPALR